MNIICGLILAILVNLACDRVLEHFYCKKHYKKDNQCGCWSCRFFNECEFSSGKREKNENKFNKGRV